MELRDIEIFLTLAEELHFGRTAERLHITQARVSQSIKKQERRLGAALFDRNSRVVRLTELGEQLRADLVPGYRQIQDAVAKASAAARGISGALRVGFSAPWCGELLTMAADRFLVQSPDCTVEIREVHLHDRFGALRSGQLDLQLVTLPVDELDIVNGPVVFSHRRALAVPSDHPFAKRQSLSLEDMAGIPLIQRECAPPYYLACHFPTHTPKGKAIPRGPSAITWDDFLAQVAAGKGATPGSELAMRYYSRPGVTWIPFHDAPPVEYGLLWPSNAETPKAKAFVKAVLDSLS